MSTELFRFQVIRGPAPRGGRVWILSPSTPAAELVEAILEESLRLPAPGSGAAARAAVAKGLLAHRGHPLRATEADRLWAVLEAVEAVVRSARTFPTRAGFLGALHGRVRETRLYDPAQRDGLDQEYLGVVTQSVWLGWHSALLSPRGERRLRRVARTWLQFVHLLEEDETSFPDRVAAVSRARLPGLAPEWGERLRDKTAAAEPPERRADTTNRLQALERIVRLLEDVLHSGVSRSLTSSEPSGREARRSGSRGGESSPRRWLPVLAPEEGHGALIRDVRSLGVEPDRHTVPELIEQFEEEAAELRAQAVRIRRRAGVLPAGFFTTQAFTRRTS